MNKERLIAALSGFVIFLAGLYVFAIMSSEVNLKSFFVLSVFAILALLFSSTIAQNFVDVKPEKSNTGGDLALIELKDKVGSLKAENIRLTKLLEEAAVTSGETQPLLAKETQDAGLMLRQRAFIHDIAGPISVVEGMIEIAVKSLEAQNLNVAKEKLEKARGAISRISQKIKENREFLIMKAS